ncbi:PREDICTED: uncharacterized protein LOC109582777 [Amphimedon queenslandica]|uniref:Uncharacterized protein n=1 Tax=Amphimedon queenslandica TaxID=400682 RepID=A0AAN0J957_AMPQE|nr:PREDICTED: uncharacterized protein LOC109582777 [Amphimedon queenslandica]|eukprot:XP_019853261.1 PREDICTED: uncharacterized protein LOC109582777 [Amphimedon queenslandica]
MSITVYPNISFGISPADDGWYKCCMPNNCSDPNTNVITFNIFRWAQIADMKVSLPSDITALPQIYTVHAIKIGSNGHHLGSAAWYYKSGTTYRHLTTSLCNKEPGFNCAIYSTGVLLDISSGTYDFSLTITWNGENITSGLLSQSSNNGDHIFVFSMVFGPLSFHPVKRARIKTITGKLNA